MTITVQYSCSCGLDRVKLVVPARGEEVVTAWLDATMIHVANDHRRRSPNCLARACDLLIPMSGGADRVGGPPIQ